MPATPSQTLFDQAVCFGCYGASLPEMLILAEWDRIAQNISPTPPAGQEILTELGFILMDETGASLFIE